MMVANDNEAIREVGRALREKLQAYLLPYQWSWLNDRSRFKSGEKSRRTGWTSVEALSAVVERLPADANDYWFSSADETAGREFIDYCRFWADFIGRAAQIVTDEEILDHKTGATLFILRFANGRRIIALSSNPKGFRSKGGDVCWDEAPWHDDQEAMWAAIEACTTWNGKMRVFGTHNGEDSWVNQNIFKVGQRIASGELNPERDGVAPWSHYRVTIEDAVAQGLVEKILRLDKPDPAARAKWLREKRATAGDAWDQEYMCIPGAESKVLLPWSVIDQQAMPAEELLGRFSKDDYGRPLPLFAGFDVGREKDLSILAAGEAVGRVLFTRHFESFAKTRYRVQEQAVRDFWAAHPIQRFCGDATGIGDMLVEYLQDRFGRYRVEKVKFTNPAKEELATGLLTKFEDHEIWVPALPAVREGLHKIRKTTTAAGNIRYDAARDAAGHADEFWALALMVAAYAVSRRRGLTHGSRRTKPKGW